MIVHYSNESFEISLPLKDPEDFFRRLSPRELTELKESLSAHVMETMKPGIPQWSLSLRISPSEIQYEKTDYNLSGSFEVGEQKESEDHA